MYTHIHSFRHTARDTVRDRSSSAVILARARSTPLRICCHDVRLHPTVALRLSRYAFRPAFRRACTARRLQNSAAKMATPACRSGADGGVGGEHGDAACGQVACGDASGGAGGGALG